jgi:hypothetical protein
LRSLESESSKSDDFGDGPAAAPQSSKESGRRSLVTAGYGRALERAAKNGSTIGIRDGADERRLDDGRPLS